MQYEQAWTWGLLMRDNSKSTKKSQRPLEHVEDVLLNRRDDATDRLLAFAETVRGQVAKIRRRPELARDASIRAT